MSDIAGIPYTTAEFDKDGKCIRQPVLPDDAQEVIIVSHGWNNDRGEAEHLYATLFANFVKVTSGDKQGHAIVGVIWPSKKFDFSEDEVAAPARGGVRAAATAGGNQEMERKRVEQALDAFDKVFEDSGKAQELAALRALVPELATPEAQAAFITTLRTMVEDSEPKADLDGSDFFYRQTDARAVFTNAMQADGGGAAGGAPQQGAHAVGAAGLGSLFGGIGNAVSSLLNITTYYEMKKRAGTVGSVGLAPLIDQFGARDVVRHIHLVGHSFGARLVTAAAMKSTTTKLYSLSLLQGAFSHNGFSKIGYFRQVIQSKRLAGPIIVTHTRNDSAVGKAYAIASRISGDHASDFGGPQDRFGGLGRNGAVKMDEGEISTTTKQLQAAGKAYALEKQRIHNLESSEFISSHGDVAGPEVAWAISQALSSAG